MGPSRARFSLKNRLLIPLLLSIVCPHPAGFAHPGASSTIEHFSHAIEHKPDDQALYMRRGIAYSNDGQFDKALADFERAKKLGEPVVVSFDLGVLHYRRRNPQIAKDYFDEYLDVFPVHLGCLEYRARLLRDMGEYEASVADFRKLFELQHRPNPGHYLSVVTMLVASDAEEGVVLSLKLLDSGIDKLGLIPQLQKRAIQLEVDRGRTDLAIKRLETLKPVLGRSPDWKVDMAVLQLQLGKKEAARSLLNKASSQLDDLRRTPARIALRKRINKMTPPTKH